MVPAVRKKAVFPREWAAICRKAAGNTALPNPPARAKIPMFSIEEYASNRLKLVQRSMKEALTSKERNPVQSSNMRAS